MSRETQASMHQDGARAYHQRTKHNLQGYAAGPATLDWSEQPNPFRTFEGCETLALQFGADKLGTTFGELYRAERVQPHLMAAHNIGVLLELSFALSAWKGFGDDRWALRCNPSSGNLHPTEAYVVATRVADLPDGVYHYTSYEHALERRCHFDDDSADTTLFLGLASIPWREAWKYGERAFRYCQLDVGHAIACASYAASALGWTVKLMQRAGDDDVENLLGINRANDFNGAEAEYAEALLAVQGNKTQEASVAAIDDLLARARRGTWHGHANMLDPRHHYEWPIIDDVTFATRKPRTVEADETGMELTIPAAVTDVGNAATIIRQRRSAQAFDATATIDAETFYRMLDMTLPRPNIAPWDALQWTPRIHLVLFVHRVNGLRPGLYALPRRQGMERELASAMREQFEWQRQDDCPAHLPLFRLLAADSRRAAATLSCHQTIASNSAFSLAMLGEFDTALAQGPWGYRRLYWEAGMLGQVLYLEAEAAGVRGTGIGCYFDDAVHETLGIKDTRFQSMYHFTVGMPIIDDRLQTLPPYAHLHAT